MNDRRTEKEREAGRGRRGNKAPAAISPETPGFWGSVLKEKSSRLFSPGLGPLPCPRCSSSGSGKPSHLLTNLNWDTSVLKPRPVGAVRSATRSLGQG